MAKSKRAQILIEPEEYERLEEIARARGVSVAHLVRVAVREKYFASGDRAAALDGILGMEVPLHGLEDPKRLKEEIERAHGAGLP